MSVPPRPLFLPPPHCLPLHPAPPRYFCPPAPLHHCTAAPSHWQFSAPSSARSVHGSLMALLETAKAEILIDDLELVLDVGGARRRGCRLCRAPRPFLILCLPSAQTFSLSLKYLEKSNSLIQRKAVTLMPVLASAVKPLALAGTPKRGFEQGSRAAHGVREAALTLPPWHVPPLCRPQRSGFSKRQSHGKRANGTLLYAMPPTQERYDRQGWCGGHANAIVFGPPADCNDVSICRSWSYGCR